MLAGYRRRCTKLLPRNDINHMGTAEIWTTGIAIYAACISTALLILRIIEFRQAGGIIKVSTSYEPAISTMPAIINVTVVNRGRGDVSVNRLDLNGPGPVTFPLSHDDLIVGGPQLPTKIEARTSVTWLVDADKVKSAIRKNGWHYKIRGIVTLGTGKQIWESIHKYTSIQ